MLRKIIIGIIVLLFSTAICFAEESSFDCKKAKTCIEKFICADKDLSTLDKKMSETYTSLLVKLRGDDKEQVKQNQIRWIKVRDLKCRKPRTIVETVYLKEFYKELYELRVKELTEWKTYTEGAKATKVVPWQKMCWTRQTPYENPFRPITGDASVCRSFEQVLNTTCEAPEKLQCNWTLPPGEKRFQKLNWQSLEFKEYKTLAEEMILGKGHKWNWHQKNPEVKKAFDEGRINIKMTAVDINNDGKVERVVHENWRTDCPARGMFGVIDTETKRLDWQYEAKLLNINGSEGAEIMLYEGEAFMFGWEPGSDILFIWNTVGEKTNVCQFKYLKGDKKK